MRETGFEGDFAAFVAHLNSDPKFFHTSPEALLAGYRDIGKRIEPELPKLFAELPRMPYGVRAMPAHLGPGAAEYYNGPSLDGKRPGWFFANVLAYRSRPIWGMETLVAHEAVPGHHLQTARATELGALPPFRRDADYTVYSEGWALYAETLGHQLGLYSDPHSRFGHLQWQAFRAARLIVDTGLHAMGWTREQAIDFMVERTGSDRDFVATEVDRYYSNPGQALAYMIGQLKIVELRDRAQARLGSTLRHPPLPQCPARPRRGAAAGARPHRRRVDRDACGWRTALTNPRWRRTAAARGGRPRAAAPSRGAAPVLTAPCPPSTHSAECRRRWSRPSASRWPASSKAHPCRSGTCSGRPSG